MSASSLLTIGQAAQSLRQGGVIAYPTEAIFGLGCDPADESAVHRILEMKNRPLSMGLILIAAEFEQILPFIAPLSTADQQRAMAAWPGPVTWLIRHAPNVPGWLVGEHPTIALRLSAHPVCRGLCEAFGGAIVSTSANPSSQEPARTAKRVAEYFGTELDGIVEGEPISRGGPSEIRDLASGRVLRQG